MVETTELKTKALKLSELESELEKKLATQGLAEGDSQPIDDDITEEELARPALTIKEASSLLGRSVRALERSILGRWGNNLPDGWIAK